MAHSDTMFFLEIKVEELKTFVTCGEFCIKGEFTDVFSVPLKVHNVIERVAPRRPGIGKGKRRSKSGQIPEQLSTAPSVQTGQTVLFATKVDTLVSNMKQYPLELSLWSKEVPDYKIGSTQIPWSALYFEYLNNLYTDQGQEPICVKGDYAIFEEASSKRMAIIKLSVNLRHFKDKITTQFRSPISQQNVMNTGLNSEPYNVSGIQAKHKPINLAEETGTVKTIYSGDKREPIDSKQKSIKKKEIKGIDQVGVEEPIAEVKPAEVERTFIKKLNNAVVHLVRSDRNLNKNSSLAIIKSKSCSSIVRKRNVNILSDYIFGGTPPGPFGKQVYCVSYFTVENNSACISPKTTSASDLLTPEKSGKGNTSGNISEDSEKKKDKYKFRLCKSECLIEPHGSRTQSVCSLDLPQKAAHLINVKKCGDVKCTYQKMREVPTPPDNRILIDLSSRRPDCCQHTEEVTGQMKATMKFGSHPCYCECECQFGFMTKTTFCKICGGFEKIGEDNHGKPNYEMPFPCPIFHKLGDKFKIKTTSSKEGESDVKKKEMKKQNVDVDQSSKKKQRRKKDARFKFNYGYTGIPPHIGHSRCALPCVGMLGAVPKNMGWLWTCENVPGLKYRPSYKPGATNKHVVRLLKIAKNPDVAFAKKRKKVDGKPKRPLKRPLLIVHKKDGEYTVTMETMRNFTKTRTYNQHPYEDKPVVTYTIGRTSEENLQRKIKKDRAKRRLERLQRDFVQSAFRDMCQDICMKTYQQALGLLPDAEKPDCTCFPALPGPDDVDEDHSCSCEEDKNLSESDTDSDEWIVEFTPPTARFDPTYKSKKLVTTDNSCQYTYLDYRVKLLDRLGNPVPRFFKGPDGKQQCSDLGGFWSEDHKWLEINVDGFIGPDERWAPNNFLGPNDEVVDGESGKFQTMDGTWLVIGVDGYVDQGKWKFYPRPRSPKTKKHRLTNKAGGGSPKKDRQTEETWSCFGSVSPKQLSKMGIVGHGHDKKLLFSKLKDLKARGENVNIPEPSTVPRIKRPKGKRGPSSAPTFIERTDCKHATPSEKGILSVDRHGNKKYFKKREFLSRRHQDRVTEVTDQGISVSPFHMPCYHSFMGTEAMKKQLYDRMVAMAEARGGGAPAGYSVSSRGRSTATSTTADYTGIYVV